MKKILFVLLFVGLGNTQAQVFPVKTDTAQSGNDDIVFYLQTGILYRYFIHDSIFNYFNNNFPGRPVAFIRHPNSHPKGDINDHLYKIEIPFRKCYKDAFDALDKLIQDGYGVRSYASISARQCDNLIPLEEAKKLTEERCMSRLNLPQK